MTNWKRREIEGKSTNENIKEEKKGKKSYEYMEEEGRG